MNVKVSSVVVFTDQLDGVGGQRVDFPDRTDILAWP